MLSVGVVMLTNHNVSMKSPDTWECKTLENCNDWKRSQSIYWWNLPDHKFVAFYETNTCHSASTAYLVSDPGQSSGAYEFKTAQPIRSVMVGTNTNYVRRPSVITAFCQSELATVKGTKEIDISAYINSNGSLADSTTH